MNEVNENQNKLIKEENATIKVGLLLELPSSYHLKCDLENEREERKKEINQLKEENDEQVNNLFFEMETQLQVSCLLVMIVSWLYRTKTNKSKYYRYCKAL